MPAHIEFRFMCFIILLFVLFVNAVFKKPGSILQCSPIHINENDLFYSYRALHALLAGRDCNHCLSFLLRRQLSFGIDRHNLLIRSLISHFLRAGDRRQHRRQRDGFAFLKRQLFGNSADLRGSHGTFLYLDFNRLRLPAGQRDDDGRASCLFLRLDRAGSVGFAGYFYERSLLRLP